MRPHIVAEERKERKKRGGKESSAVMLIKPVGKKVTKKKGTFKDGAYYCYCAYVLHISRYSDFLSPMLTNTGIFLRGLKLSGESRS